MTLAIRGVAHPAPPRNGQRQNRADLNGAEIDATNLSGKPLLCEHDSSERVGTVLASWKGADGSLRIAANVEDANAISQIKRGEMRGLSLGTSMILGESGNVAFRGQDELSICSEGKRPGTWCVARPSPNWDPVCETRSVFLGRIDSLNGVPCRTVACFSKKSAAGDLMITKR
tara:strand:- start:6433 stop:6951 length:519 start_codon:yes stop_codon:yes gene_type:complete